MSYSNLLSSFLPEVFNGDGSKQGAEDEDQDETCVEGEEEEEGGTEGEGDRLERDIKRIQSFKKTTIPCNKKAASVHHIWCDIKEVQGFKP